MPLPPFVRDVFPFVAGAIVVVLLVALLILLRRRTTRRRTASLARQERALEALSLLRDSRLVPPPMEQAVEVFDVEALLGDEAVAAAAPAPVDAPPRAARRNEGNDTLGGLGAASEQPVAAESAPARTLPERNAERGSGERGLGADVPIRDLVLVWFEARGYQASVASRAVLPIEYVLRHRGDPARAYAFVALSERLTAELGAGLIERAHGLGLERLLVTSEDGAERTVRRALRRQGLRLMDRGAIDDALAKMEFRVAAKIVAVAAARDQARATNSTQ
jgi:hypothetical protein